MFVIGALLVLALDQASKWAVMNWMHLRQSIDLPGGLVQLTYIHNSGGAFGLFPEGGPLFLITGLLVTGGMLWALPRIERWGWLTSTACAMILGGTVGNLVDRIRFGSVVDFIDLRWWPIFNVADMGISVGITLLIAQMLLSPQERGGEVEPAEPEAEPETDEALHVQAGAWPRTEAGLEPEPQLEA